MSASTRPMTLDELFGTPDTSAARPPASHAVSVNAASTPETFFAPQPATPQSNVSVDLFSVAANSPQLRETPQQPRRDLSPSPPASLVRVLRGGASAMSPCDYSESDESATSRFRGVQRGNVEYSAISATVSREPTHGSYSTPVSATSRTSVSGGDVVASYATSAINRLTSGPTPSASALSDMAGDDAAAGAGAARTGPSEEDGVSADGLYSTLALLRQFLAERQRIATENSTAQQKSAAGEAPRLPRAAASHGSQVFDALRSAHLVPSVVPAVAAAEANAEAAVAGKPEQGPYLIESTLMRGATIATVLKRQRAERHAAYAAAHPFFRSQTPLAEAAPAAALPTRLPTVLDMPLDLRCSMCQRHDAMCNRCHQRWSKLQESYKYEAAVRCYSTLDVNRRGSLALLTAALGTGSFLEMMSIADGLTLTQTRVRVAPSSLELLLNSCGRVLSTTVEDRLARTEDAALPSRGMWLKVAHVGCLFGQRDVLRSLWLRCRGGCSYAAQITTNGLHALELLAEPYEPALQAVMNRCAALREYLLWARIMQCLAVRAAVDDAEATQLCEELRQTGSWVGVWSEALLAYVKGEKERCAELCDELLILGADEEVAGATARPEAAATATPANALSAGTDSESVVSAAARTDPALRASTAVSFTSSAADAATPPPSSMPTPALSQANLSTAATAAAAASFALPSSASTNYHHHHHNSASLSSASTSAAAVCFSVRPAMDLSRIRGLKELAMRPPEPLPRLEAYEEEAPTTPVRAFEAATEELVKDTAGVVKAGNANGAVVCCLRVRRLPFGLMRRILSFCDAAALVHLHDATAMPLLRWITQARFKCLPPAQWTRLLTANAGYAALRDAVCNFVPAPVLSREEREAAQAFPSTSALPPNEGSVDRAARAKGIEHSNTNETQAGDAVAMACGPFEALRVSVIDVEDLAHLTVKATTLCHKTAQGSIDEDAGTSLTVGQWLLRSLFGRATSLVNESKYLVVSRVCRLAAQSGTAANVGNSDVSKWEWEVVRPWEVDINATVRWCTYVQQHTEAAKLL